MVNNQINKLISVENIFEYFKNSGYIVETDEFAFPLSELIEKPIEGDVWTVIDRTNLTVLIIKAPKYNRKSYRNKIISNLKELVGIKIIFFTCDFNDYNLTLIFDGIFNIKFNPSNPDMLATRIFESIESQEDLFDYTKQDINFILLKRELTANALKEAIQEEDNSSVKLTFQEGGLKLIGEGVNKIIISQEDAPVKDMIIDVKLEYKQIELKKNDLDYYIENYKKKSRQDLKLCCLITSDGLIYHWIPYSLSGFISFKNTLNEDITDDVLESLIAQVSYRTAFNSETFHQQFGMNSPFFLLGKLKFFKFFNTKQKHIEILYKEWKERFSKVYQAGDLDVDLFIKHSYLSLLIKTVLYSKFIEEINEDNDSNKVGDLKKISKVFENRGIPIFFNDFFQWSAEEYTVQNEVFGPLKNAEFKIDDLFRTIYQEMVSPETRHALGEFYTPAPLAERMVEEVYKFGDSVLDPACGSGTFLVEILKKINDSYKKISEKIQAASKIYGFDINPIAVLVARSNILLIEDKMFGKDAKLPLNVFLTDSLKPIDEFDISGQFAALDKWGTAKFGQTERFHMQSVNSSVVINVKFFDYLDEFGNLLKELDNNFSIYSNFDELIKFTYKNTENLWLDEKCEGSSKDTLRENFEDIAKKLYNLMKADKNHIWAYLLFNALGVRRMKKTLKGVDLLIGNPPWLTIHDILSYNYKEQIKNLLKSSGIYIGGKQAPHAELCSLFFYKTRDLYLKKNGKIFFVTTAGLETGDHHSKFRLFNGFKDIYMWKFLNDVFNIPSICLGAINGAQPLLERLKIQTKIFDVFYSNKNWEFELKKEEIYLPYNYNTIAKDKEAKKFVSESKLDKLLPINESKYMNEFYQGASLVPRNLIFIVVSSKKEKVSIITPNLKVGSKKPWDFIPYDKAEVENEYIFNCIKSTELVPFSCLNKFKVFLPINKNLKYDPANMLPKAKKLYQSLEQIYKKRQESDERVITDFWKNINHLNKLVNPLQKHNIKVIYNASGSNLKSAIIKDQIIIDTTLFYIGLDDINEAYYLCAILNSYIMINNIKVIKSSRHIHKRPFSFPIPEYDENDKKHQKIVDLSKICEQRVMDIITNLKLKKLNSLKTKIECIHCGKQYSKSSFKNFREKHEKECSRVDKNYKWALEDWIDLENSNINNVILKRNRVKNYIFNNVNFKEKMEELDKLVIQLFKPNK